MRNVLTYFWVALGSAVGGVSRYLVGLVAVSWLGGGFPWGTIFINLGGSFVITAFAAVTAPGGRLPLGTDARQFVMVGFCGGYTTFSSFSLETVTLLERGAPMAALANVGLSMLFCLAAAWLGHAMALRVNRAFR